MDSTSLGVMPVNDLFCACLSMCGAYDSMRTHMFDSNYLACQSVVASTVNSSRTFENIPEHSRTFQNIPSREKKEKVKYNEPKSTE